MAGVELFNKLLEALNQSGGNANLVRNYNLRGYSKHNLETIKYDVCQHLGISEKDLVSYIEEREEIEAKASTPSVSSGEVLSRFEEILKEMNAEEREGFKISTKYPFLREESCPNELKILVNDAISAYYRFSEKHEKLFEITSNEQFIDTGEIYNIAADLLKDFDINQDIHRELEHYSKTGEILGEHSIFSDLKIKREVEKMSALELAKAKNNIKTYISKKKKELKKAKAEQRAKLEQEISSLEAKRRLIDGRLEEK